MHTSHYLTNADFGFSVLMSLFYKELPAYLDKCLESLFQQSLLPNEIIIVTEGELTTGHEEILNKWKTIFEIKNKITFKVIPSEEVKGLPKCLNIGLKAAEYNYIARFDTDDICRPCRFEKQINFLRNNPEVTLLGSQIEEFDETMLISKGLRKVPCSNKAIVKFSKWRNPFNHMTVIYKKDVAIKLGGYPIMTANEDYAFWCKFIVNKLPCANLPDILVNARAGNGLISRRRGMKYFKGDIASINYLNSINHYNKFQYLLNLLIRLGTRFLPSNQLGLIYKFLRKVG